jgi:SAM-dependent methyltransferase
MSPSQFKHCTIGNEPSREAFMDATPNVDMDKLNQFMGKMLGDVGAAANTALIRTGDRLGLYTALADKGPITSIEPAKATGTTERYVREWLSAQAASGYVDYDPGTAKFSMQPEQVMVFADEDSPVFMGAVGDLMAAMMLDEPKVSDAFKSGKGVGWNDRAECLFCGTARFFRAGYHAHLITEWLPALDGMVDKLQSGAKVADVGCGHGASTTLMARAFPRSEFVGVDYHAPSIDVARQRAREAGAGNARFEAADATGYGEHGFDLVCFFDCLHDMGDPAGAAAHARQALKPDGHCMLVEPFAGDSVAENLNPVGRVYYGASAQICVPVSLARNGPALGAQAGEAKLGAIMREAGFGRFRRATQTPFNLVLEARP